MTATNPVIDTADNSRLVSEVSGAIRVVYETRVRVVSGPLDRSNLCSLFLLLLFLASNVSSAKLLMLGFLLGEGLILFSSLLFLLIVSSDSNTSNPVVDTADNSTLGELSLAVLSMDEAGMYMGRVFLLEKSLLLVSLDLVLLGLHGSIDCLRVCFGPGDLLL